MKKLRWGILSTAKIGLEKVIPAMQRGKYCEIAAIASRNIQKAEAEAERLGIPRAYGSYEKLLADKEIDAIYNPLPNHLHVKWSIKSLEAKKHVLCEKPISLSVNEAESLITYSQKNPRLKIMEAFMYRHHPQWQLAKKLVNNGEIGDLKNIHSFFSYHNTDPLDIRNNAEIGGGGLMDIGCYCISLARFIFSKEPKRVFGKIEADPKFNTDRMCSGMMEFSGGFSSFTCSTQLVPFQNVQIFGTKGRIEIEIPFNAPSDEPCKLIHHSENKLNEISIELCNQYTIQADLFSQAILNNSDVPTPITDSVANMKVLEAIIISSKSNSWSIV